MQNFSISGRPSTASGNALPFSSVEANSRPSWVGTDSFVRSAIARCDSRTSDDFGNLDQQRPRGGSQLRDLRRETVSSSRAMTMNWRSGLDTELLREVPLRAREVVGPSAHSSIRRSEERLSGRAVRLSAGREVNGSRLVQGDPYAVFSMGDELSVVLGSFGEDDEYVRMSV